MKILSSRRSIGFLILILFFYNPITASFAAENNEDSQTIISDNQATYTDEEPLPPQEMPKFVKPMPKRVFKIFGFEVESLKNTVPNKTHDIAFTITLVIVTIVAFLGKRINEIYVQQWLKYHFSLIKENFSKWDIDGYMTKQVSWNCYEIFATGRKNCKYMNLYIECIPRQCVWRGVFFHLFKKLEDTVTIQFTMDNLDPIIFAICSKKERASVIESSEDIKQYCRSYKSSMLQNYTILSESHEAKDLILQPSFIKSINQLGQHIKLIHISDQFPDSSAHIRKVVRIVIRLPIFENMNDIESTLLFAMSLIDYCATLHYPDKIKTSIKNLRADRDKKLSLNNEELLEAEDKRRVDKKKADDELFKKLTPQQQRKLEDKQNKASGRLRLRSI